MKRTGHEAPPVADGVSRASRKYNKTRPSVCFWLGRYDGSLQWLASRGGTQAHR